MDELFTIRAITCILKIDVINCHFFKWKNKNQNWVSKAMKEKYNDNVQEYFRFHLKIEKKWEWILADTGLPHWSDFTQFSETKRQ